MSHSVRAPAAESLTIPAATIPNNWTASVTAYSVPCAIANGASLGKWSGERNRTRYQEHVGSALLRGLTIVDELELLERRDLEIIGKQPD